MADRRDVEAKRRKYIQVGLGSTVYLEHKIGLGRGKEFVS